MDPDLTQAPINANAAINVAVGAETPVPNREPGEVLLVYDGVGEDLAQLVAERKD